jgi:response regulator RpfG family c-di-GMP phosphodiesterase
MNKRGSQGAVTSKREASSSTEAALRVLRASYLDAKPKDAKRVEQQLHHICENPQHLSVEDISTAFFESSFFFISIGLPSKAVELGEKGLEFAQASRDLRLMRRAHSVIGYVYACFVDFESSSFHLSRALQVATELGDPIGEMATLTNICSCLELVGLRTVAKSLAVSIARTFASEAGAKDRLHFQNSTNALKWCAETHDAAHGEFFLAMACRAKETTAELLSGVALAHFESNAAAFLLSIGALARAKEYVELLGGRRADSNQTISVLFELTLARYRLATEDLDGINLSIRELQSIQQLKSALPEQHEEILCMLITLARRLQGAEGEVIRNSHALREHLVRKKHKGFFTFQNWNRAQKFSELSGPVYPIPALVTHRLLNELKQEEGHLQLSTNEQFRERMQLACASFSPETNQFCAPSEAYIIAEHWAIAAELMTGDDGSHCFRVGRLVKQIYLLLGESEERAEIAELASRLHDVGKLCSSSAFIAKRDRRITLGDWCLTREHTIVGHSTLSVASDPVLVLAAEIARHHHEWWNGCGLPDGKIGEAIPLGARVCAVANCLLSFLDGDEGWPVEGSLRQLSSMGGVQLDPTIVDRVLSQVEVLPNSLAGDCARGS